MYQRCQLWEVVVQRSAFFWFSLITLYSFRTEHGCVKDFSVVVISNVLGLRVASSNPFGCGILRKFFLLLLSCFSCYLLSNYYSVELTARKYLHFQKLKSIQFKFLVHCKNVWKFFPKLYTIICGQWILE